MEDTIAAIATAYGEGGIGIVRISGDQAKSILGQVFVPKKLPDISNIDNRRLYYGNIIDKDNSELIDEVLAVYMQGPRTYTAEDVVEIYCHGSIVSLRKTLSLVLRKGARLAEKGEFTKRAFLNGRLDLSQAEAVMDLISAKTDKSFNVALGQMEGQLSERIKAIRSELMDVLVNITVNLDYPDEDIEEITYNSLTNSLSAISDDIDKLIATADTGRIIREGLNVVIIGKPNVGKSSLMNALLKESRAIVTEIPGTTRDTIEEVISIRNIPVKITDTAGIRETDDAIEKIGIEKSKASFNRADLIILILDGSEPLSQEDYDIIDYVGNRKIIAFIFS
jgi:tRNA modification GTPase